MPKPKKPKSKEYWAYQFTWEDACSIIGWKPLETMHLRKGITVHSIGYVLHQDKNYVTFTTSIGTNGNAADPFTVPMAWVKSMKRLKQVVEYVDD